MLLWLVIAPVAVKCVPGWRWVYDPAYGLRIRRYRSPCKAAGCTGGGLMSLLGFIPGVRVALTRATRYVEYDS